MWTNAPGYNLTTNEGIIEPEPGQGAGPPQRLAVMRLTGDPNRPSGL